MSPAIFFELLALSAFIPVIMAVIRRGRMHRAYRPFLIVIVMGAITELLSDLAVNLGHTNAGISMLFELLQFLILTWQIMVWEGKKWNSSAYLTLAIILFALWIIENTIKRFHQFSGAFIVAASGALVIMAINQANKLIAQEKENLLKNAKFLICIAFIFFFTTRVIGESFYVFLTGQTLAFSIKILTIESWVNVFANLLYAYAIFRIPARQRFALTS